MAVVSAVALTFAGTFLTSGGTVWWEWLLLGVAIVAGIASGVLVKRERDSRAATQAVRGGVIEAAYCAAGGVAPIPLYLEKTAAFLRGKPVDHATVREAARVADAEIAPISDVRGSAEYKRLLLRQLFYAAFLTHCEDRVQWGELR